MPKPPSTLVQLSWKNVLAAAPLLFLAGVYGRALFADAPAIRPLAFVIRVEFMVINSFPFVVVVALARPETLWGKLFQFGLFGGLMWLFSVMAFANGWEAVALFLSLTAATYLGFLLNLHDEQAKVLLALRWLVTFMLLILVAVLAGLPENTESWNRSWATIYTGLVYFTILGTLEVIGFYQARLESA